MTKEAICIKKPYLDVHDIMELMDCKENKAYMYIRAIKSISDVGQTAGRVMVRDFNLWAYGTTDLNNQTAVTEFHITPIRRIKREVS